MLEVFEKHLKEAQKNSKLIHFLEKTEKTKTIDEQVELCKQFIKDNAPPLPSPDLDIRLTVEPVRPVARVNTGKVQWLMAEERMDRSSISYIDDNENVRRMVERNLISKLLHEIIKSGIVTVEYQVDYASLDLIWRAEVGVVTK